ncbi:MAG: dienelactone hydrolase family protein [Pseudomonadota bacterium]
MATQKRTTDYTIDGETFEAVIASPGKPSPGVMICHAWAGRSDFENKKAEAIAELGYAGVAIDLFGKGVLGKSKEENQKLIEPFVGDRAMLQRRLKENIEFVRSLDEVDADNIAVIGFCFGGLCALDVARSGADVKGVVSFHGLLGAPGNTVSEISAKVLALHGYADPMAPPDDVTSLGEELTKAKADWQLHAYGGVMHAFTNPQASDPEFGTVYDAGADRRSWRAMSNFLSEIFE